MPSWPELCAALVAFGLNALLRRVLSAIGVYRFVWHRPLFDLAIGCALIFAGSGTWRLVSSAGRLPRAGRVAAELSAAERERQTSRSPRAPQGPRR